MSIIDQLVVILVDTSRSHLAVEYWRGVWLGDWSFDQSGSNKLLQICKLFVENPRGLLCLLLYLRRIHTISFRKWLWLSSWSVHIMCIFTSFVNILANEPVDNRLHSRTISIPAKFFHHLTDEDSFFRRINRFGCELCFYFLFDLRFGHLGWKQ